MEEVADVDKVEVVDATERTMITTKMIKNSIKSITRDKNKPTAYIIKKIAMLIMRDVLGQLLLDHIWLKTATISQTITK